MLQFRELRKEELRDRLKKEGVLAEKDQNGHICYVLDGSDCKNEECKKRGGCYFFIRDSSGNFSPGHQLIESAIACSFQFRSLTQEEKEGFKAFIS
ncbi:MAG: hypothetical protein WC582_02220 [Patescibacteria group bacterium]